MILRPVELVDIICVESELTRKVFCRQRKVGLSTISVQPSEIREGKWFSFVLLGSGLYLGDRSR